jgi:Ca2+-binding EF-hand superfamily protein
VLKSVGENPTQDELDVIYKEVSINKKAIDFPEFILVLMRCLKKKSFSWTHDDCLNVFKRLFKRDKTLDIRFMLKELKRVGVDVSYDELLLLINESHIHEDYVNDQGEFNFKELFEMMDKMENLMEK